LAKKKGGEAALPTAAHPQNIAAKTWMVPNASPAFGFFPLERDENGQQKLGDLEMTCCLQFKNTRQDFATFTI